MGCVLNGVAFPILTSIYSNVKNITIRLFWFDIRSSVAHINLTPCYVVKGFGH